MSGAWNVEQQARSGLGQLVWLKAAGPFNTRAEAEMIADRVAQRHGLPTRVTLLPPPPANTLDRLFENRPCRIVARPRQPSPGRGRISIVDVEFADGSRQTVSQFSLRRR
ncbi:MAG: hypothetical protein KGQ52_13910 [Alphaproteobacteria bacterium]|nr:hypothetical protein [Alphaproteobacteria bacterium]